MRLRAAWGLLLGAVLAFTAGATQPILVLQSDFGTLDGAVAAMKGVAVGVSPDVTRKKRSKPGAPSSSNA